MLIKVYLQGYLSRALCDLGFHVLALDSSDVQTQGAERRREWEQKGKNRSAFAHDQTTESSADSRLANLHDRPKGTLTHKTVHIDPSTLNNAVASWLEGATAASDEIIENVPVLIVALHACGSLTPDILRVFLSCHDTPLSTSRPLHTRWTPQAVVVVGCCYNMMSPAGTRLNNDLILSDLNTHPSLRT